MGGERTITVDDLYRSLRFHDKEILKHFNDETLSDQMYLFYAINSDIVSNAISIILCLETGNIDSIGVDNCCRTIIEAFAVLKMISLGEISDEQARIFRYHYAIVDFSNMRKFTSENARWSDDFKYVERDRERAYEAILNFHKCSKKDLRNDPDLDDSNFYLKKKLGYKLRFSELLKKYDVFDNDTYKIYDFFSLFIHPRYEFDLEVEEGIREIRFKYVEQVINYITQFLKECKLFVFDDSNTFKQDFYDNPVVIGNVQNVGDIRIIFDGLEKKLCNFPEGVNGFERFFLRTMEAIITDMIVNMTLGYKEHIISLFKSAFEYIAVHACINELELEDFKKVKLAYCYSSRLQINNILQKMKLPLLFGDETINGLKEVFDGYYKEKYELDDFEEFVNKVSHNARYFLDKDKNKFNNIVNKLLDDVYDNPLEREYTRMIYKIAKDMNHGGGYSFNASPGLIDSMCRHSKNAIYKYMSMHLFNAQQSLKEHNIDVDLSFEMKMFNVLSAVEKAEIEKVNQDYLKKE